MLRSAVNFYATKLMHPQLCKYIAVVVTFKDLKGSLIGSTDVLNVDDPKPRAFELELDQNSSKKKVFITLAHEMVHVKQYATQELKPMYRLSHKVKWMDELHDDDLQDDDIYWDAPWEIEANGREYGLYKRFFISWKDK